MSRILVTLVTGFLGSGKTTLLNSLLNHPDMSHSAVIVNEFGEIGLDYDLIERSDESVVQLENGCLCCSVKSDLIDTFRDLHMLRQSGEVPKFDRVVVETTGIADPGPVLQIILTDPLVSTCYALDGVVTLIDVINGEETLDNFNESVHQAAIADRIILTKTDLLGGNERENRLTRINDRLQKLNPRAIIYQSQERKLNPSDVFGNGLLDADAIKKDIDSWQQFDSDTSDVDGEHSDHSHHTHDPLINTFCLVRDEAISIDTLRLFLEALAREAGPDLLRVKGIVNVAERPEAPAVIQGAQQIFHSLKWLADWPSDDRRTRIIFITRGMDQVYIEDSFDLIERVTARAAAGFSQAV
jgi:G3E family GTPase